MSAFHIHITEPSSTCPTVHSLEQGKASSCTLPSPELHTTLGIPVLQHPSTTVLGMQKGNKHTAVVYKAPKHMPTLE